MVSNLKLIDFHKVTEAGSGRDNYVNKCQASIWHVKSTKITMKLFHD